MWKVAAFACLAIALFATGPVSGTMCYYCQPSYPATDCSNYVRDAHTMRCAYNQCTKITRYNSQGTIQHTLGCHHSGTGLPGCKTTYSGITTCVCEGDLCNSANINNNVSFPALTLVFLTSSFALLRC